MTERITITLVTWQGDRKAARTALECILAEGKTSGGLNPFVLESGFTTWEQRPRAEAKSELATYVKTFGPGDVPWMSPEDFVAASEKMGKRSQAKLLAGKHFFLLLPQEALAKAKQLSRHLWVFLAADTMSATFLYRAISSYGRDESSCPEITVWHLGTGMIETAAQQHLVIQEQIQSLLPGIPSPYFAGSLLLDPQKLQLADELKLPLLELFHGDSLHGSVKAGLKRIELRGGPQNQEEVQHLLRGLTEA